MIGFLLLFFFVGVAHTEALTGHPPVVDADTVNTRSAMWNKKPFK